MLRPSGLHENCFAPHINRNKGLSINCPARHAFGVHDHGLQLRKTRQIELGNVLALLKAMKGTIKVRASVL